jgi:cyanate permease
MLEVIARTWGNLRAGSRRAALRAALMLGAVLGAATVLPLNTDSWAGALTTWTGLAALAAGVAALAAGERPGGPDLNRWDETLLFAALHAIGQAVP